MRSDLGGSSCGPVDALTGVVVWLPGRFPLGHGLHEGCKNPPWTTRKGRLSGRPEPPVGRRDVHRHWGEREASGDGGRADRQDSQDGGLRGSLAGVDAGRCERPRPEGWAMADRESVDGLGLAEAIAALRDDLLTARAAGATSENQ